MNAEHRATIEAALRHYGRYRAEFGRSATEQLDLDAKHRVAIDEALTALHALPAPPPELDEESDYEDPPPANVLKAMARIAIYAATYGTNQMYLRDPVVAKPIAVVQEWLQEYGYTFDE